MSEDVLHLHNKRIHLEFLISIIFPLLFQMFNHCLAPNTFGDGTGCDNMTCIIIVLQPNEAEPHKRCASEMDSCTSTEEEGVAEKRTKLESDSPTSCTDSSV